MLKPVTVTIDERGRIMLPVALRKQLELSPGDRLVLHVEQDALKAQSIRKTIAAFRGRLKDVDSDTNWADELIEERRREAKEE